MEFRDSPEEAEFRQEVKRFIEDDLPEPLRNQRTEWGLFNVRGRRIDPGVIQAWRRKLATRGWLAPAWPVEYGGAGMSVMRQFIFNEEMALARAPAGGGIGIGWAGPTLMVHGSEEQKRRFLPAIASGEETWCQGFSEPGAGSDLAALQTRAVRDGDDFVVNGQKIWTSGAHLARWMILLARTDPDAPKHRGISYFLLDMKSPGIDVQPLVNMLGSHEFNQVYFDNVRIPARNVVGEENRGWYEATTTLDVERSNIGSSVSHVQVVHELIRLASSLRAGSAGVHGVRVEMAERLIEAQVARMMSYHVISLQHRGRLPNKEASVAKLFSSELDQRIAGTAMRLLGLRGQLTDVEDQRAPAGGRVPRFYLHSVSSTIGGGTSEIQRNIIATRGLGLPRA